jgi:hypothetical protein
LSLLRSLGLLGWCAYCAARENLSVDRIGIIL